MSSEEFTALEALIQRKYRTVNAFPAESAEHVRSLSQMGFLEIFPGGAYNVTAEGRSAFQQYLRARSDIVQAAAREARSLEAEESTAASLNSLAAELASLRSGLENTADELRDYKAQQTKQRDADIVQARIDKKKDRRNQFLVSAFTVAFTLFLEHLGDVEKFAKLALKAISSLLQ